MFGAKALNNILSQILKESGAGVKQDAINKWIDSKWLMAAKNAQEIPDELKFDPSNLAKGPKANRREGIDYVKSTTTPKSGTIDWTRAPNISRSS